MSDRPDCIEYQGCKKHDGYGWVTYKNKQMGAHRAAWIKANGQIPAGMCVLHKCDNPPCVNLDHLYLGTHGKNMEDRSIRQRTNLTKLATADVISIRRLRLSGWSVKDIASRFDVTAAAIYAILSGRSRRHE